MIRINEHLDLICKRLASQTGFDDLISAELGGAVDHPGERKVMVVVVDDLDRCSPTFVHSVLETVQQWSDVENLFFFLAVDRDVLSEAIRQRTVPNAVTSDVALEKYVQLSIEIPELVLLTMS